MSVLSNIEEYHRPATLDEALNLLRNPGSAVLAGGTHLFASANNVKVVVDINNLGLSYIREENGPIRIGATTSLQEISSNEHLKRIADGILAKAAKETTVSRQLRNAKTIAGEIVSAKPESLLPVALLALDARLRISDSDSGENARTLSLDQFYKSRRSNAGIITEIEIPVTSSQTAIEKLSIIESSIPFISIAVALSFDGSICKHARVVVGSGVSLPHRVLLAEGHLMGSKMHEEAIGEAAEMVFQQVRCFSDTKASAEYRRAMSKVLVRRALVSASGVNANN